MAKPFFTLEDFKIAFSLVCAVFGIGTLGMPANFSRAGPVIAVISMIFMAVTNIYASIAMSKVLLVAPKSVRTYSDLGEWCLGKTGRWLVIFAQMAICLLAPCAFLVLGGTLLKDLFPGSFSGTTWICLMALMVLPVCLIPTLKEGAGAAFAGCMGTLVGCVIAIVVMLHGMAGHPSPPSPHLTFKQVATAFGNMSLAYGAGIVIPTLQRQHSEPTRMPRVIMVSIGLISCIFLIIASLGYSAVGCQISGNILFTIYPDATTGVSPLGFKPNWGIVVLSFLFMQLHITVAFSVIVSPAFYMLERFILGMHKPKASDIEGGDNYIDVVTPSADVAVETAEVSQKIRVSANSVVSIADIEKESLEYDEEISEYQGANAIKYALLRVVIIVLLVLASIALEDHFLDLVDFIGASCITMNSMLLPVACYMKKFAPSLPLYEKVLAGIAMTICLALGCYVTYTSGKALFVGDSSDVAFPFCDTEYQNTIYYVKNTTSS